MSGINGTVLLIKSCQLKPEETKIMSKGQVSKKDSKKKPAKTMKEKRAAKREKKDEKMKRGLIE